MTVQPMNNHLLIGHRLNYYKKSLFSNKIVDNYHGL